MHISVKTITIYLFSLLIFPSILSAQSDVARQAVINETELDKLHTLWIENSAKWERNRERVALFDARHPGMAELRDTTMLLRLMGFSERGEPIYYQTLNLFAAKTLNTNRLWSGGSSELNLNGEGITLNIWDGGSIRHTHQEFGNRTTQMDEDAIMNGHATHVAGTMVSAGMVPTAKGMAPAAELHVYDFGDDEAEMMQAAMDGAILSNHSYGRPTGWLFHMNQWWWYGDTRVSDVTDYKFGFYSEETRVRDEIAYMAPYFLQVHAAGNDRGTSGPAVGEEHNVFDHELGQWVKSSDYREPDGGYEGYDCISTLVLGKNVITVGSVHDLPEYTGPESLVLSDFSNTGPADDGRIKPDVVANGQSLLSTWVDTNTSYVSLTGTSMAAPNVTGSLGLIQQLNKELYGSYLRASTLKALMIHTTREAGEHPGPDYLHGWGLADMEAAAKILPHKDNATIIQERNLVQTVIPKYSRTVYAHGQEPLVATLAWTDVPGTPPEPTLNDRTPMLVNDLDLRITRVSDEEQFYPWKLDPDNPSAPATQGDNVVDNVEKIEIFFPEPGEYIVEVSHKDSIVDPLNETNKRQAFSLVISGIAERAIDLGIDNAYILDEGCDFSENTPAEILLANFGQQAATNIPVSWQIKNNSGEAVDSDSIIVDQLAAGVDTILEVYPNLSQGLEFEFIATVNYPGDQLPANNTFSREVVSINWPVSDKVFHTDFDDILYIEDLGWHVVNANSNASGWMLRIATGENQFASSGYNSMRYGKLNPGNDGVETMEDADDWLITSCFYLLEGENYRFRFDYRAWDPDYPESMRLMIGTSPFTDDFSAELINLEGFANQEFITEDVQFTVPETDTYYFAFHVYSQADHRFIYLDNLFLERILFDDLQALDIEVEAEGCGFDEQTPVLASFLNNGLDPQQDFEVELMVKHLISEVYNTYSYHFDQVLESGMTHSHEFLVDMSLHGLYELTLITLLEGDENPANDSLTVWINNTDINLDQENYFTNFDDVTNLEEMGWSAFSNSGGSTGWRFHTLSGQAYSPPNSLNMYRYQADPDDWAFSNCFMMEEGDYYRIHFYKATKGTNTEEQFSLHLMEEPSPDGAIAHIADIVITTFDYVKDEVIFQAPYTGNFYIGLYTDYVGPNTFMILVDDFGVESLLEYDAATVDIIQQTWGCNAFTDETPVKVVIENKGLVELVEAQVQLTVTSPQTATNTYTLDSIKALGLSEQDTLQFFVDLSNLNTIYTLTAEVILPEDQNTANNIYERKIRNTTVDLTTGDVYFNDFEMVEVDGHSALVDPLTGWWHENTNNDFHADGTPISWVMRKNAPFARSGEISMRSGRSLENPADDWLFSNCFIMQEGENYLMTVYHTGRSTSFEERLSVYLGDEQQSGSMDQLLWHKTFSTGLDYQQAVVAFTPPSDGTYYIGFHAHSEADQGWIYLDDFEMQKNHGIDLSLDNIEILEDACSFSEFTPIRITFRNSGNQIIEDPVYVTYEVINPGGQVIAGGEEQVDEVLEVNQVGFLDVFADMRFYGKYTINAGVGLPDDISEPETGNNNRSVSIFSTALNPDVHDVYITFEKYDDLDDSGWTVIDANNDGYTWDLGVGYTAYSYSGSNMMYYSFSPDNVADDWLFSSCANLKAGPVYVASFYYRVFLGDFSENMRFVVAGAPHPDAIIQELDSKEDMHNYTYQKASYAFTVEEDGQYYLGFQAFSEKYRRYIFMDDFALRKANAMDGFVYAVVADADACDFGVETPVKLIVSNLGGTPLPAGELEINIAGPTGNQEFTLSTPETGVLGSGDVLFEADLSEPGRYTVNHSMLISGEEQSITIQGAHNIFAWNLDLSSPGRWHIQDYEGVVAMREKGWTSHNLNQDNRYWGLRVNDPAFSHSGSSYLVYFTGNITHAANDWAISGCYELEGGRRYKAGFYCLLGSGNHNMRLAWGNAPHAENMDGIIWEETGMTAGAEIEFTQFGGVFEVPETGRYYFGIQQFSPPGQGSSIIDDFVVIAQPDIIPLDQAVLPGEEISVTALGSDSLRWYSDADLNHQIGQGTTLHYIVTEEEGFQLYAAEFVHGIHGPADSLTVSVAVGLETPDVAAGMVLYPNPARDHLQVTLYDEFSGTMTVQIMNIMGEIVKHSIRDYGKQFVLDISGFPHGTYFVVIRSDRKQWTGRFVKQQ